MAAAHAAAKTKGSYLRDKSYRLKARRVYKRAAVTIGHKILVSIYHMISQNVSYNDLGDFYLDTMSQLFAQVRWQESLLKAPSSNKT